MPPVSESRILDGSTLRRNSEQDELIDASIQSSSQITASPETQYASKQIKGNKLEFFDSYNTDNLKSDIGAAVTAKGLGDRFRLDWYNKFSRFGLLDPYNALTGTKEYVFITRPDLCLFNLNNNAISPVLGNVPFFVDSLSRYRDIATQLQGSIGRSPFMNVLSNSITSPLDVPGIDANMIETSANIYGTTISYRSTSVQSDQDFQFNTEFEDDKYLDVYMLFKIWDEYERLKWNGQLRFHKYDSCLRWSAYIKNKILHDQVSMYKIVVDDTGTRIIYFARITGCIPTSIPRDAFSDMSSTQQKLTVGWKGHFVRDMDPIILVHFNQILANRGLSTSYDKYTELPLYDAENHMMNGAWAAYPYIEARQVSDSHGTRRDYFLRWKSR